MNLIQLLDRPIAFHRCLVEACGSVNAALMFGQAIYWSQRLPPDRDGWFWKTREEWEEEIGLTREEQEGARRLLIRRNLLEERREGLPAKLHYRVVQTSLRETLQQDGAKPSNKMEQNPPTPNNTETTSEITPPEASGFPSKESEAVACARMIGVPDHFAIKTWELAMSRGGTDSRQNPIRSFAHHLKVSWKYEQEKELKTRKKPAYNQI